MQTCISCKLALNDDAFAWRNKSKGLKQRTCRQCRKIYFKKHYSSNKDYYFNKAKISRKRIKDFIATFKIDKACFDCGVIYPPYVYDFDHLFNKTIDLSSAYRSGFSNERLIEEIQKCNLVCANCHRIRTFKAKK